MCVCMYIYIWGDDHQFFIVLCLEFQCILDMILKDFTLDVEFFFQNTFYTFFFPHSKM